MQSYSQAASDACRVELYEVGSHGEQRRFDPLLGTRPRRPAKAVEMAIVAFPSGVLLHHAEAIGRDVQLGSLGILQLHELAALMRDIEERHAAIASHPIVDVDNTVARVQRGKVVEELRSTTRRDNFFLFLFAKDIGMA